MYVLYMYSSVLYFVHMCTIYIHRTYTDCIREHTVRPMRLHVLNRQYEVVALIRLLLLLVDHGVRERDATGDAT